MARRVACSLGLLIGAGWVGAAIAADPFRRGDANGDGYVDLADLYAIVGSIYCGGVVLCPDGMDVNDDGQLDQFDILRLLNFLFLTVLSAPPAPYPGCGIDPTDDDLASCTYPPANCPFPAVVPIDPDYRLELAGPEAMLTGAPGDEVELEVTVRLSAPEASQVQGWSLGLGVDPGSSCRVTAATTAGTAVDDFKGTLGFFASTPSPDELDGKGAVSGVLLGFKGCAPALLDPGAGPHALLKLTLEATVPASGCTPCRLELLDGLRPESPPLGLGEAVANYLVLVEGARRVRPARTPLTVLVGPGTGLLEPGAPETIDLASGQCSSLHCLRVEPARALLITLSDPDSSHANALAFRWAEPPGPGLFDIASEPRDEPSPRLVVPYTRDDLGFVLVEAADCSAGPRRLTLLVELVDLALHGMSARSVGRTEEGTVSSRILGAGFRRGTRFRLEESRGGHRISTESVRVLGSDLADVVFQAGGAPAGSYDLVAEDPGGGQSARLPEAFRVTDTSLGSILEVVLDMEPQYRKRDSDVRTLKVRYANRGDQEMPAPLLKLVAPPRAELLPPGETELQGREVQLLGIDPRGVPGALPPGAAGAIPVDFTTADPGDPVSRLASFKVEVLAPRRLALVGWESLPAPPGIPASEWPRLRAALADPVEGLGPRWVDYARALGRLANRLPLRGTHPASVKALFRLAVQEAYQRPTAAILGTVRDAKGRPLRSARAVALAAGKVAAGALTDKHGYFALDGLEPGTYQVGIEEHDVGVVEVKVDSREEVSALDLVALPKEDVTYPEAPPANASGLPLAALTSPEEPFELATGNSVTVLQAIDPNTKTGTSGQGEGDLDLVAPGQRLRYTVYFENCGDPAKCPELTVANAPAQVVRIEDVLSPRVDSATFCFEEARFGRKEQPSFLGPSASGVEAGRVLTTVDQCPRALDEEVQLLSAVSGPKLDLRVHLKACLAEGKDAAGDPVTKVVWDLRTRDAYGSEAIPPAAGFLSPNNPQGDGQGHVSYSVALRDEVSDGEDITNTAEITFDENAPLSVAKTLRVTSAQRPLPRPANPRPASGMEGVALRPTLQWGRHEDHERYDIFLWKASDGPSPPARPLASGLKTPGFRPFTRLATLTAYLWKVKAFGGGKTAESEVWRFTTEAGPRFVRGDANGDGQIDLSDAVSVLDYLFKGGPEPLCLEAADANGDRQRDISDPISLLSYLFLGGAPPPPPSPSHANEYPSSDCGPAPGDSGAAECEFSSPCE